MAEVVGVEPFVHYREKVLPLAEAADCTRQLQRDGRAVVTINGSFDLLHSGHIYIIQEAKKRGDILIVGLNSNESYRQYKDKRGPLLDERDRARMLAALEDVDYVTLFDEPDCLRFIEAIRPDVHCNGAEYGEECVEAETVRKVGARLHLVPMHDLPVPSTTRLVSRIAERYSQAARKAVFLDRDGIINVDTGYPHRLEDFKFVRGILSVLTDLQRKGYLLVIITNQSGIARGKFTEEDMHAFNDHMLEELRQRNITIAGLYYCPHHPEGRVREYTRTCDCRKPGFMLFQRAKKELQIDMAASWTVGDSRRDCAAGKRAGTHTILVSNDPQAAGDPTVDYAVSRLTEVTGIIG